MTRKFIITASFICLSLFSIAQRVSVYEDCNYGGKGSLLCIGRYTLGQMGIGNDQLSSFRVPYGLKLTIYENDFFQGRSRAFTGDVYCLDRDWNDFASSVVVESTDNYNNNNGNYGNSITFYNDNYSGYSADLQPGNYYGFQLGQLKYNISSFRINNPDLQVRFYADENLSSYLATYDMSQGSLPGNVNDRVGSLVVERKTGNPGYTNGGNNTGADFTEGVYAVFYSDCNYQGNALRLRQGRYYSNDLGTLRNTIASMLVPPGLQVKFTVDNNKIFGWSPAENYSQNVACFDNNFRNASIGTITIEARSGWIWNRDRDKRNDGVTLYADDDYGGNSVTLRPGSYNSLNQVSGFQDGMLSSIWIPAGYSVVLYENENFNGASYTLTSSSKGLRLMGWNDRASSIKVMKN